MTVSLQLGKVCGNHDLWASSCSHQLICLGWQAHLIWVTHLFVTGDPTEMVSSRLYSGLIPEHLFHFAAKLLSCNNYVTICGGLTSIADSRGSDCTLNVRSYGDFLYMKMPTYLWFSPYYPRQIESKYQLDLFDHKPMVDWVHIFSILVQSTKLVLKTATDCKWSQIRSLPRKQQL